MSELVDRTFWKRLEMFVADVQVNDMMSEEEKEYILRTAKRNIDAESEFKNLPQAFVNRSCPTCGHLPCLCRVPLGNFG